MVAFLWLFTEVGQHHGVGSLMQQCAKTWKHPSPPSSTHRADTGQPLEKNNEESITYVSPHVSVEHDM